MIPRKYIVAILGLILAWPLCGADPLKETEFTARDAIRLLNAKAWSFSYSPPKPVRRLDVLIYEERTDDAGKTRTTIHYGCTLGMLPKERIFPIKLLLVGNDLHIAIDSSANKIKVSDEFVPKPVGYRKTGDCKEDKNRRRFLIEVGNEKENNGQAPFKNELKFRIYENLDQPTLNLLLGGGQPPETAKAEQAVPPNGP